MPRESRIHVLLVPQLLLSVLEGCLSTFFCIFVYRSLCVSGLLLLFTCPCLVPSLRSSSSATHTERLSHLLTRHCPWLNFSYAPLSPLPDQALTLSATIQPSHPPTLNPGNPLPCQTCLDQFYQDSYHLEKISPPLLSDCSCLPLPRILLDQSSRIPPTLDVTSQQFSIHP